jgi:SAM-dependent methyltransferase
VVLAEMAWPGLHERLLELLPLPFGGGKAIDLGCGTGALARRLAAVGWSVEIADRDPTKSDAEFPYHCLDLNKPVSGQNALGRFDLVTAVEVIEHLENPIQLLRTIGTLLRDDGLAVVTTPSMDGFHARARFLLKGKLRCMDEWGDPTHISPIFEGLLPRLTQRAGLELEGIERFQLEHRRLLWRVIDRLDPKAGECLILFLRQTVVAASPSEPTLL